MSVDTRRFAAAQRTAAQRPGARRFRLASWFLIVPTLALFSFSVVAGAAGFGSKPDYAAAAKAVTPASLKAAPASLRAAPASVKAAPAKAQPVPAQPEGRYVVVESSQTGESGAISRLFGDNPGRSVCWITQSQYDVVAAKYKTLKLNIKVGPSDDGLVSVYGANDHDLRTLLGGDVNCRLVKVAHIFFLPFDAHGS